MERGRRRAVQRQRRAQVARSREKPREPKGEHARARAAPLEPVDLELLFTSAKGFGLVKATPLQRALCRIAAGKPIDDLLAKHPELGEVLERTMYPPAGAAKDAKEDKDAPAPCTRVGLGLPGVMPLELYILCGIRCAKSLLCAAIGLAAALNADLSMLLPGEEACVSIVSVKLQKAKIIMRHLKGGLRGPLKALLARKPTESTVWIRRPTDGRIVRIELAAGANAGNSLVGDWSAGAIFDEWTRMNGEADGSIINFDDMRKAVLARLVPGAQLVGVGSPWAPRGPAYETVRDYWGKPSSRIVVLRPPSRSMNPDYWTDDRIEALRKSPKGEWIYRTDFLGEFADPESAFFATAELEAVIRAAPRETPRDPQAQYFAAMDPATRRNAWTLVIGARVYRKDGTYKIVIALARQWVPRAGAPLRPEDVLAEIKADCKRYGIHEVFTDQWSSDALAAIGRQLKFTVTKHELTTKDIVQMYDALRMRVLAGRDSIELHPEPYLRGDLLAVRKVVTNQAHRIELPVTSDGRHADFAPPTALVCELASKAPSWVHAMRKVKREGLRVGY